MRLREFSAGGEDIATLVCAPFALHDATLTDFAPDHSLVAALQMAGLRNVFVTDWRSASPCVRGAHLLQVWKHPPLEPEAIHGLLQVSDDITTPRSLRLITLFSEWHARPIDLPGTYYLQVVQWLYKDNH